MDIAAEAELLARLISKAEFRAYGVDGSSHVRIDHAAIDGLDVRSREPHPRTKDEGSGGREVHLDIQVAEVVVPLDIGGSGGGSRSIEQAAEVSDSGTGEVRIAVIRADAPPVGHIV